MSTHGSEHRNLKPTNGSFLVRFIKTIRIQQQNHWVNILNHYILLVHCIPGVRLRLKRFKTIFSGYLLLLLRLLRLLHSCLKRPNVHKIHFLFTKLGSNDQSKYWLLGSCPMKTFLRIPSTYLWWITKLRTIRITSVFLATIEIHWKPKKVYLYKRN